jgi:hypothetical protein
MTELIFLVEEAPDGGYAAKALGEAIFTQAGDLAELHKNLREAVACHFDESNGPSLLRLYYVKDEVLDMRRPISFIPPATPD